MRAYRSGVDSKATQLDSQLDEAREVRLRHGAVTLRPWHEGDAEALVARIGDQAIVDFLDRIPQPYRQQDALDYIRSCEEGWRTRSHTNFAICVEPLDGAVGSIGVGWGEIEEGVAEVGYWVAAEARGRGVATSATQLVARWAFESEPRLERLQLRADVANVASNRVAEKAGFTREGVLRSLRRNLRFGRSVDFVMWSVLRDELD
jgi:[ribosomal protein S5]-alanine N-acetyltransferase